MRAAFSGTLSVKMRSGWDAQSLNAPEFARIAVAEGAELISVHGRTRAQQYRGQADRGIIGRVVEAVPGTPVLANGDVNRPADAFAMLAETGAAGVMIGRGAMGNPWIFEQILAHANGGVVRKPTREQRFKTIERHIALMESTFDEPAALAANLKKYLAAYSKGLPGSGAFRQTVLEANELDFILGRARDFFGGLGRAA
jgi:tRNA-dihydrouridine synthase B